MANEAFDPQNPVYPPGCYAVTTPNKITFREPNTTGRPEMNFNKFMYFSPKPGSGNLQIVGDQCIRDIIRSPKSPWEAKLQGKKMIMIGPGGAPVPAHLPNLVDLVGVVDVKELFEKLNNEVITYGPNEISEVIPDFLLSVVDPTPVLAIEGPVYPLTIRKVNTELACYTDGFQVFYLHSKSSEFIVRVCASKYMVDSFMRYVDVHLESKYQEKCDAFALGSSVVLWNARGVSRPSFRGNALEIFRVHKPIIFIITEVRISRKSFKDIVRSFQYEANWNLDESVGNAGGIAVIWDDKKVVSGEFNIAAMALDECPLRMLGVLKVVSAKEEEEATA